MTDLTPDVLVTTLRDALREMADLTRAPGQQAYMKSTMPFLGVRVPAARALTRAEAIGIKDATLLTTAALTLWREAAYREERYAAQELMSLRPLRGLIDLLPVHEEIIRTGAWWDHVDEAATRLADLHNSHPAEMAVEMRIWADDRDLWIRRAAIISQLRRRDGTDRELLAATIEANITDKDFFIRKAIGWALRDFSRTDGTWVREFVAQHPDLSPLSQREALRPLSFKSD